MGNVVHTKIKCRRTKDDVLIITTSTVANFWGADYGETVIKCPHSNGNGCELTPKDRIVCYDDKKQHSSCLY